MLDRLIKYWKLHRPSILVALASILFYAVFAYDLERTNFVKLLTLFAALFFFCFKLIQFEKWNFKLLLALGILFRLVFLLATPNLSQDFYRFIWDGELIRLGYNPYLHLPNDLILQSDLGIANASELYNGMGELSARHYSNYPPMNQFFFMLSAVFGGKTILGAAMAMRFTIIFADVGIFYFGRKLLKHINRSPHLIFWYFLNPLVIIELCGNLHFEGVMLFFFIWAMFLISVNRWFPAAIVYALSISVKLIPLIFLPLFFTHFKLKRSILFYGTVAIVVILSFLPFLSETLIDNYSETVGLWFSNFEFNAGVYNMVKKIALQFDAKPWELIKVYGKITPLVVIAAVLFFTFYKKNRTLSGLVGSMLAVLAIYYFLSSTVHPWYLISLILLSVFTEFRFPLFWSALVILSYSAYSNADYHENLSVLFFEYFIVFAFLIYEIFRLKGQKLLFRKN